MWKLLGLEEYYQYHLNTKYLGGIGKVNSNSFLGCGIGQSPWPVGSVGFMLGGEGCPILELIIIYVSIVHV